MDGSTWTITRVCKNSICPARSNLSGSIIHYNFIEGNEYIIHHKTWNTFDSYHTPYIILDEIEYRIMSRHSFIENTFLSEHESREYKLNKILGNGE